MIYRDCSLNNMNKVTLCPLQLTNHVQAMFFIYLFIYLAHNWAFTVNIVFTLFTKLCDYPLCKANSLYIFSKSVLKTGAEGCFKGNGKSAQSFFVNGC